MKTCTPAMAVAVALLVRGFAVADDAPERIPVNPVPTGQPISANLIATPEVMSPVANGPVGPVAYGPGGPVSGGWDQSGLIFRVDLAFLKYHQAGGVRDSRNQAADNGEDAEFGFDLSPRYTVAWDFGGGLGVRASYWHFDQSEGTSDGLSFVSIKASTLDIEVFRRIALMPGTNFELFGGLRWSDFDQADGLGLGYDFSGFGGTIGIEGSQSLCNWGRVYARARWSIIMGDAHLTGSGDLDDAPTTYVDNTMTQTELAFGWDNCCRVCNCATLVYGLGVEWHQWSNAAIAGDDSDEGAFYDAGWAGFVARIGLAF